MKRALLVLLLVGCRTRPEEAEAPDLAVAGEVGWPMAGHDAQNRSSSGRPGPHGPGLRWKATAYRFGPLRVGADGVVYALFQTRTAPPTDGVCALDPADGRVLWTQPVYAPSGLALGPTGTIYTTSGVAVPKVVALDRIDPSWKWSTDLDGAGTPLVIGPDGTIYAATFSGVTALGPADGKPRWSARLPQNPLGMALGLDGTVVVTAGRRITWLDAASGQPRASRQLRDAEFIVRGPSVGLDGSVYVVIIERGARLDALDPDGRTRWSRPLVGMTAHNAPAVAADGSIHVAIDGVLHVFGPDGASRWSFDGARGPVLDSDGTGYVAAGSLGAASRLLAIAAGKVAWETDAGLPVVELALGDRALYVTTGDGLLAYGP